MTIHAALWRGEKNIKDLGTLTGDNCSFAWNINEKGQAAGLSFTENGSCVYPSPTITEQRAVVWDNGKIIDLSSQIPHDSRLRLVLAQQINNRGEIVGLGLPPGIPLSDFEFHGHAFVLIPCDENHDDSECEDEGKGTAVARGEASQRPNVVSPENVRKMFRQRLGSRHHIRGLEAPKN